MAKKKSAKSGPPKKEKAPAPAQAEQESQVRPLIRAIRVSQEVLDAAKTYKKAKGVSFYQLGLEAISERLARERAISKPRRRRRNACRGGAT